MSASYAAITNLLYLYAEKIDSGDLEGASHLFRHARVRTRDSQFIDEAGLLALWRKHVVIYECGTPRTKHVVTNPIVEVDDEAGTATARSYYTVLQATAGLSLQPIAAGRYHDRFERVDGLWRFCERDYSLLDMAGDMSHHLRGYQGLA
ncbi:nuclear transport factor 2 family protein [Parahaliea mediterranea]|uniref:nuclear transport factor 2 family protein n=1 Tax=Parahaliea mediterranea TaxID=651086 RepID=UPI000E2E94CF|nr:nuclear transport factor 2 family protein [Parahaliea mediterranea]